MTDNYARILNQPIEPDVHIKDHYHLVYSVGEKQYSHTYGFDIVRKKWKFPDRAPMSSVAVAMENSVSLAAIEPSVGRIFYVDQDGHMNVMSAFYVGTDYLMTASVFNLPFVAAKDRKDIAAGIISENELWVRQATDSETCKARASQLSYFFTSLSDAWWSSRNMYSELALVGFTQELALFKVVKRLDIDPAPKQVFIPAKEVPIPKDRDYMNPKYAISVISYPSMVNRLQAMEDHSALLDHEKAVVPNPLLDESILYLGNNVKTISPGYLIEEICASDIFVNATMTCFVSKGSCGGVVVRSASSVEFIGIVIGGLMKHNSNVFILSTNPQVEKLLRLMAQDTKDPLQYKGIVALL